VVVCLEFGSLSLLEPSGPVQACNGIALPLHLTTHRKHIHDISAVTRIRRNLLPSASISARAGILYVNVDHQVGFPLVITEDS